MKDIQQLFKENHLDSKNNTDQTQQYYYELNKYIAEGKDSGLTKFRNFSRYTPRQVMTEFLVRHHIFQEIVDVPGSIVECGVLYGQGLFSFAQFSSIYEPVHYNRKIIGFDTFSGFEELDEKDTKTSPSEHMEQGGFCADSYEELNKAVELFDMNRTLGHIPKIELVKGDVQDTIPTYLQENPHLIISLLYLDMDVYAPTKFALEQLVSRIPKGGVIAFDEINVKNWPGETMAVDEVLGIRNLRLKKLPIDSRISYAIVE